MRSSGPIWWFCLGRALPRSVRRRVFEPACYDLYRKWLRSTRRARRWYALRALAALACSYVASVRMISRRRVFGVARVSLLLLALLFTAIVGDWLIWMAKHGE